MKVLEARRTQSTLDAIKKAVALIDEAKVPRAKKALESLAKKLAAKLSGAKKASTKPRKPSAFSLYVSKHSKEAQAANPGKKMSEIMKILSKMYHAEQDGAPAPAARGRSRSPSPARGRSKSPKRAPSPKRAKSPAKKAPKKK